MSETALQSEAIMSSVLIAVGGRLTSAPVSFERFLEISRQFPEFRMEHEPNGQITIMPPTFYGSGNRESELNGMLWYWNRQHNAGQTCSPSIGIQLPDGSTRSPAAAWISNDRMAAATNLESSFLQVVPDFVAEIRSFSDDIVKLRAKMLDTWMRHGVRLAWLIDPYDEKVWIYRENGTVELIEGFTGRVLTGETVLPGMELELGVMAAKK